MFTRKRLLKKLSLFVYFLYILRLQNLEEDLITKNIKLVIVDSIASLVRKEFDSRGSKNMIERTNLLAKEAAILKYVAEEFKIPVSMTKFGSIDLSFS